MPFIRKILVLFTRTIQSVTHLCLWLVTQHHCTTTSVVPQSRAIAYQSLSGEDIGSIDMAAVWEGMALQQGHKSCLWPSHCQHSLTSADKALCSPQNTHRFWRGKKRVQPLSAAAYTQQQSNAVEGVRKACLGSFSMWQNGESVTH